jgi:hypothetical protein
VIAVPEENNPFLVRAGLVGFLRPSIVLTEKVRELPIDEVVIGAADDVGFGGVVEAFKLAVAAEINAVGILSQTRSGMPSSSALRRSLAILMSLERGKRVGCQTRSIGIFHSLEAGRQ